MNKLISLTLTAATVLATLSVPALAQDDDDDAPPAEVIATLTPVYFEGHAAYWYHNRWHYRDGARWARYNAEPGYLHDWRGGHPVDRHYYGGHFGGHGGGRRR
jgi:hypothetical protein